MDKGLCALLVSTGIAAVFCGVSLWLEWTAASLLSVLLVANLASGSLLWWLSTRPRKTVDEDGYVRYVRN